jgi:3-dehydroquinate dehydratase-2
VSGTLYVLNGPNLNLLGVREPHLYGSTTLAQVEQLCHRVAGELGFACEFRQSNHEGVLVDWVQEARERSAAVVINPAGLSFRSIPLLDALKTLDQPIAEVHVTNIHRRDPLYQDSLVSLAATGVICGFGAYGYELAIRALANRLAH